MNMEKLSEGHKPGEESKKLNDEELKKISDKEAIAELERMYKRSEICWLNKTKQEI